MSEDPPRRSWRASATQDQRRAMNRRREMVVSIRKQRKEAALQKKRGLATQSGRNDVNVLNSSLDSYLQAPMDVERGTRLKNALSASHDFSGEFLQRLLDEDQPKASALISGLTQNLQALETRGIALDILLAVTSISSSTQSAPDDSYYGQAPLSWSDVLVGGPNSVTSTLIQLLSIPESHSMDTVLNTLGNLVQDSAAALKAVLPHWPLLVRHLPTASYCCAAIIRQDVTHYGMDFLKDLSTNQITKLLLDDNTCTEAAWIIEGLSRREDQAVNVLCADGVSSERTLISRLIQRLNNDGACKEFLVPALRAICNITSACEGRYVYMFLLQPSFVETINRLLEECTQIDAVSVAGCLLTDSGVPGHPSTLMAVPNFLPRLVSILTSEHTRFEWRRDAAHAICNGAVNLPPATVEMPSTAEIQSILQTALSEFVWTNDEAHQHKLVQALIDLLKSKDNDAVVPAIQIVDCLVRAIESSRIVFESCGGVDILEDSFPYSEMASQLAADLIDDIFDADAELEYSAAALPTVENNQFVFGSSQQPPPPVAFDFGNASPAGGRGRGRTMPAWMQRQEHLK